MSFQYDVAHCLQVVFWTALRCVDVLFSPSRRPRIRPVWSRNFSSVLATTASTHFSNHQCLQVAFHNIKSSAQGHRLPFPNEEIGTVVFWEGLTQQCWLLNMKWHWWDRTKSKINYQELPSNATVQVATSDRGGFKPTVSEHETDSTIIRKNEQASANLLRCQTSSAPKWRQWRVNIDDFGLQDISCILWINRVPIGLGYPKFCVAPSMQCH